MKYKLVITLIILVVTSYVLFSLSIWNWNWETITTASKFFLQWWLTILFVVPIIIFICELED